MFGSSPSQQSEPGTCPTCDAQATIDPSLWFGETKCSNCGELLWLIRFNHGLMAFKPSERVKQRQLQEVLAEYVGVEPAKLDPQGEMDLGIDSLDFVELVMELEEEEAPV